MGGQAFATSGPNGTPLGVPRMPSDVYRKVASDIQSRLKGIFRSVVVPREAPGKPNHGDVDILVEGALCKWTPTSIGQEIGALHRITHGGTHSYAIPYPDLPGSFVQIDVEICPGNDTPDGAELFEWTKFMKNDSDLMQIIGVSHRSLGITSNDRGLHVRVKEIEPHNKKKSQIFLTRNPEEAMAFLGLDISKYWTGFATEDELFEWVSRGRFFSHTFLDERTEKANDRQRIRKRGMYRRFMEEYMPTLRETGTLDEPWTRQGVLEEALTSFNKHEKYRIMMDEYVTQERSDALWKRIKETLPLEGSSLGMTLKGLKRWVGFKDGQPYISPTRLTDDPPTWILAMGNTGVDQVLVWVKENWAEAKALEKTYVRAAKEAGKTKG
ncbi:uncharacterized protein BDR25DRAFT_266373 [Lindgomyces ingoldianus]|uniref:Uncharacterized protein n=1 Tax=Lindgomyces ingoldianus TaxID=673940 RepID=A0ACB6QP35_9PLEO|nr:uncharacterized protein BDR25DRAFT_266373 [Lindgomyces ingoldianus]KAF2467916.1 hypothetical protein BDR25DRAFT_266373 [Lindgomyces ingoldianus]